MLLEERKVSEFDQWQYFGSSEWKTVKKKKKKEKQHILMNQ